RRGLGVLERYRYTIAAVGIAMTVLPRLPGIGRQVNGAYLAIHVGGVSFQPSELSKIAIVIFLASYLRDNRQLLVTAGRRVLALSLFAQADGGLLGTGFDQSLLRLPHHGTPILPVPESDTIYAVIVNELGLAGATALLLTYLLFVARGLKTAALARDSFSKLLAVGLAFVVAMQVFVIVGGGTRG